MQWLPGWAILSVCGTTKKSVPSFTCSLQEIIKGLRSSESSEIFKNLIMLSGTKVKWSNYSKWELLSAKTFGNLAYQEA